LDEKKLFAEKKTQLKKKSSKRMDGGSPKSKRVKHEHKPGEIVFEAIPVTQVVCNFARTIAVAKDQPCTAIGKKLASNFVRVASTRIFADPYQSIMELVSNAIDASVPAQNKSIGRFGMGFFSIFALLLSTKDFDKVTVTTTKDLTFQVDIVVRNEELTATLINTKTVDHTGTSIRLESSKPLGEKVVGAIKQMVRRFKFVTGVNIQVNSQWACRSDPRNKNIEISIGDTFFYIVDHGTGMDLDNLRGLLTPSVSTKGLQSRSAAEEEKEELPTYLVLDAHERSFAICVNGVLIKLVQLDEEDEPQNGTLSVVLLPPSAKLPVARNDVILSHPATFELMKFALDGLFTKHAARKNVSVLRALLREYSRECMQVEAYKLVQWLDERILASNAVLIPDDNPAVVTVCKELGLDFVVSDLFVMTKLQKKIFEASTKEQMDAKRFHQRTAIVLKTLTKPIETIPCLSGLVFVREDANKADVENYSQDVSNGCMTSEQFDAWERNGLTVPEITSFIGDSHEFEAIKKREDSILSHPTLMMAHTIWQRKFVVLAKESLESHMVDFVKLWTLVAMDMKQLDEVVSILAAKLASARITGRTSGKKYVAKLGACTFIVPTKKLPHNFRRTRERPAWFFDQEPIPSLELEWLKFKLELFPDQVENDQTYAQFFTHEVNENCGFADLAHSWLNTALIEYVILVFGWCHRGSLHILETFIIAILVKLYYDAFFLDENFIQYVVGHIRQELRKKVSLDQLILMVSQTVLAGFPQHPRLIVATIVNPIYSTFPILSDSTTEPHFYGVRPTINRWISDDPLTVLCDFTVNDLMMFAYTNENLKSASDLMTPKGLQELDSFAKNTNHGKCDIQAVLIAANFGTTKSIIVSILTELFQNSFDAMLGLAAKDQKVSISVDPGEFHFEDPVGIPFAKIMTLLLPFYSEKRMDANASGEMGTGFFNLFRQGVLREVKIATKFKSESGVLITAAPLVAGDGFVTNVQVRFETLPAKTPCGTEICGYFNTQNDRVRLVTELFLTSVQNFCFAPFPVFLNDKQVNREVAKTIYKVPDVLTVSGFVTGEHAIPSLITINNVPFGPLRDHWNALISRTQNHIGTKTMAVSSHRLLQMASQTNLCVNISKNQLQPVQSRDKLVFVDRSLVKGHLLRAQVIWLLMLYGEGTIDQYIENTQARQDLDQLLFLDPPYTDGSKLDKRWAPNKIQDFFKLLHWVIYKVLENGQVNQGRVANDIIDTLEIHKLYRKALRRWFVAKTLTAEQELAKLGELAVREEQKVVQDSEILDKKLFTDVPVLTAFVKACVESFNAAEITLTKFHLHDPDETVTCSQTTVPNIIGCVNDNTHLDADGMYMPGRSALLLSTRHRVMAENLLAAISRTAVHELDRVFAGLVQVNFFQATDMPECTMLHELVHHMFEDHHSPIAHPQLQIVFKGEKPFKHNFGTIVIALQNKLFEKGLCEKFLNHLRTDVLKTA